MGEEKLYAAFKHWDLGDILGVPKARSCARARASSPSRPASIRLLTKNLRPLPDKFHGIADQEIKYRQRYVDLITDESARQPFR